MKTFLVLVATFCVASATVVQFSPTLYTAAIPITTQYHAQDGLGQYSYGYSGGPSAKAEYKSLDGVTRGSYSYVDADGELQTVEYTADSANGFQASATNLPKAPIDDKTAPMPVEDTPEVAMAKVEHFAAYREAELRAAEEPSNGDESDNQNGNGNGMVNRNGNGNQEDQASSNGSQEQSGEATSAETESPNNLDRSNERSSEQSESNASNQQSSNGNQNENGANGITRLNTDLSNSFSGLGTNGFSLGDLTSINLGSINGNSKLSSAALNSLSNLQLSADLTSSLNSNNGPMHFSDITPATTSQLRPFALTALRVPTSSYLRVSTPTHGYSIISPTVLTAVPTLRATSSQTISRTLPLSLSSSFLTQELH